MLTAGCAMRTDAATATNAFIAGHPQQQYISALAQRLRVDRDEVLSIAWIVARVLAGKRRKLAESVKTWRMRVHDQVRDLGYSKRSLNFELLSIELVSDCPTPEWHAITSEEDADLLTSTNGFHTIQSDARSESILHPPTLAKRMRISVRHARRHIARWRRQDNLWGDG